jgi:hypothetical protein
MKGPTIEMRARLRDTQTGEEAWYSMQVDPEYATSDHQRFWWLEGNGACDCNRLADLHRALGRDVDFKDDDVYRCGDERVRLMEVQIGGVTMDWCDDDERGAQ